MYHACADHARLLHTHLGRAAGNPLLSALPLFPTNHGVTVSRAAMVLAVDRVKTFGRWLSGATLRYLCESHIVDMAGVMRRHRVGAMLDGGEDGRLTPQASGPALRTPDALQRLRTCLQRPLPWINRQQQTPGAVGGTQRARAPVSPMQSIGIAALGVRATVVLRLVHIHEVCHKREITASSRAVESCTTGSGNVPSISSLSVSVSGGRVGLERMSGAEFVRTNT